MSKTIHVKKRNGRIDELNINKINLCAERACKGLDNVSASEIVLDTHIQLYDKIPTTEIDKALILTARSKIYKEPNYSLAAARLLTSYLYKEVFGENRDEDGFEMQYRLSFVRQIKVMVKKGLLHQNCLSFDLKRLSEALFPERDLIFKYHGIQNIYDRYLLRDEKSRVTETPQAFYMRVAMGLCWNEEDKESRAIEFYNIYSQHLASPSTPTLFNSAGVSNQLSSCYLSEIEDSVDGIFDGLWQEARKSKYAGGLGFHVTKLRSTNSKIVGTNGSSSGLVPWMKIYNDMLIAVNQGGKRNGSGCAYLEPWHFDVEDFIDLRKETGEERRRTHDLNTALWCPDIFFRRVEEDGEWSLFCPNEAKELPELFGAAFDKAYLDLEKKGKNNELKNYRNIKAKDLWKKILKSYFETSHPWITHKDNANIRYSNGHEGILHGSNLCTEIFLHSKHSEYKDGKKTKIGETAVCNLSSINVSAFVEKDKINYSKMSKVIHSVIRSLDNVIDINFYPTDEARSSNFRHRPIGMGTMGWADLYHKLDVVQDSDEGVKLADELMEFISYHAILASAELARERGKYPSYDGSTWSKNLLPIDTFNNLLEYKGSKRDASGKLDWKSVRNLIGEFGMRNSNTMAIAPNASIAYQLGVEQSIEPNFSVLFSYENKSGRYYIINDHFVNDMKKNGIWNAALAEAVKAVDGDTSQLDIPEKYKLKYKTCFDRDQNKLIEACAARQKWIDQGISFNGYNKGNSLKLLNDYYLLSNKLGLKSNYYLRNVPASKVQKTTVKSLDTSTDDPRKAFNEMINKAKEAAANGDACEMCQG